MSLFGALTTATTALSTQQAAIQVTGNNIANVGNTNYAREQAVVTPNVSTEIKQGVYVGSGVDITDVHREVDDALNNRLRGSVSDNQAAQTTATYVGQVQSTLNALSGSDLSDQMNTFFDSWSTLANEPTDDGQRQVVVQEGANLANYAQTLDGQLKRVGRERQPGAAEADEHGQRPRVADRQPERPDRHRRGVGRRAGRGAPGPAGHGPEPAVAADERDVRRAADRHGQRVRRQPATGRRADEPRAVAVDRLRRGRRADPDRHVRRQRRDRPDHQRSARRAPGRAGPGSPTRGGGSAR